MPTLELRDDDKSTTYVFATGASDRHALRDGIQGLGVTLDGFTQTASTRRWGIRFKVTETTNAALRENLRAIEEALVRAEERYRSGIGTPIVLKAQLGTTDADDIEFTVIRGAVSYPSSTMNAPTLDGFTIIGAVAEIETELIGRVSTTASVGPEELENEVDSNANYFDISNSSSAGGSDGAYLDLEIADEGTNAWNDSKRTWVWTSDDTTNATFFQNASDTPTEVQDPDTSGAGTTFASGTTGGVTTNASGGTSAYAQWTSDGAVTLDNTGWTSIGYFQTNITAANLPEGEFRVLARIQYDEVSTSPATGASDFAMALGWVFGTESLIPSVGSSSVKAQTGDAVAITAGEDNWGYIDIGRISIPPSTIPSSVTAPTLNIRVYIHAWLNGQSMPVTTKFRLSLDSVVLARTDQNFVVIDSVSASDKIKINSQGTYPSVMLMNSSDVFQSFATKVGNVPFKIGPDDTRVFWLRDDTDDPTTIKADVTGSQQYITRGLGVE